MRNHRRLTVQGITALVMLEEAVRVKTMTALNDEMTSDSLGLFDASVAE